MWQNLLMLTYILRALTGFSEIILCAKLLYTVKGTVILLIPFYSGAVLVWKKTW